jgi:hypothetical protein
VTARTLVLALALLPACRQEMYDQPKVPPLRPDGFFADGLSARLPPRGTVSRTPGAPERATGLLSDGTPVRELPLPLSPSLLRRGRERYGIFCAPCHDRAGTGRGMIVERGFKAPPSFHLDRLREAPLGRFFEVITNGFGEMSPYASVIPPDDRWAIAAHVRVLQLSQHAAIESLPEGDRRRVEEGR